MNRNLREAVDGNEFVRGIAIKSTVNKLRAFSRGKIGEKEFMGCVIDLAQLLGWKVLHIRAGRTLDGWEVPVQGDGKGFPDLFMLRPTSGQRLAAELKVGTNTVSDEQNDWLNWMEACETPAFVWRPCDAGEIVEVLTKGAK